MKTVTRMIRRYIVAALGCTVLLFTVNLALFLGVVIHYGVKKQEQGYFPVGKLAASFTQSANGSYAPDPALDWQSHFSWAMLLDEDGSIAWSENLPEALNHDYTVPEVASFSRWYLADYPVMVYRNDFGLLVAGKPKGSLTRFDFYMDNDVLNTLLSNFFPLLILDGGILLFLCLLLGWRAAKPLRELAGGIERLAEGESVRLAKKGDTGELAEKLNQTSRRLQEQNARIAQRDTARTNWIAGVSHDIRTPLSLILGYAEQLERMAPTDSEAQNKAASICVQSQKIKALIEDLNLTSKLEYDAQPLRICEIHVGPWLRKCIANFSNGLGDGCDISLEISDAAEQSVLKADEVLLERAIDNLLNNSVRHNPDGCQITVSADIQNSRFVLVIRDNGIGYPKPVLRNLGNSDAQNDTNAPHILGLHLVRQIVKAHGGEVAFRNDHGAVAILYLNI